MVQHIDAPERTGKRLFTLVGLVLTIVGLTVLGSESARNLLLAGVAMWEGEPTDPQRFGREFRTLGVELGVEALVGGILLLSLAWFVLPRRKQAMALLQRKHVLAALAVVTLVGFYLPVILSGQSAVIAGERYWWLRDDAMVSMRYAHNLANGVGLVWNPGEYVGGYSNFLWTMVMAAVHVLPLPMSKTSLVMLVLNLALAALTVPVLIRLVHALDGGTLTTAATLAGYVLSADVMHWTTTGMETTLLTLLFVTATWRVLEDAQQQRVGWLTYLLMGSVALVRSDALVLSVLLYATSLALNRDRKRVLIFAGLSFLLPLAQIAVRVYYYGDILPNTAYLKLISWDARYVAGVRYVLDFARHYAFPIGFAVVGSAISSSASRRLLLGMALLFTAYVAYVGGDAFEHARFLVPVIPVWMALAFLGIRSLCVLRMWQVTLGALCLVTVPLIVPDYTDALFPDEDNVGNVRIGLLLKHNTPPNSKVADFWAGSVFYFSGRYGIDLLGKTDPYIAHLEAVSDGLKPGHNKFDFDHSLGELKPDFVIANFDLPVQESKMRRLARGNYAFTGQLYLHRLFREHCLPYPVSIDTSRTIFVCDWSPELTNREKWAELPAGK